MKVIAYDKYENPALESIVEYVPFEQLLKQSDLISLHCPLTEETYHLIDIEAIERMKDGVILVNTSRGAIFDQAELENELMLGRFRAVLDVYEKEPLPLDSPLRACENVLLMPHMAGPTTDLLQEITRELLLESAAYLDRGLPLRHDVSRERASIMTVDPKTLMKGKGK